MKVNSSPNDNVKLMGEMIALQALRNVLPYDFEVVSELYNGLVKDLNHISQIDYTITDGYDYAQTAICFLYQFKGMYVSDIYGKDKSGKYITIKTACYRAVDKELLHFRRKIARNRQIDICHNKKDIPDPRDCFADKSEDYAKADRLLEALHLTEVELETLNCCMNKMKRSEIAAELGITIHGVRYRKLRIRQKFNTYEKTLLTT
jgi:bacterial regulatory proteins, luxR family